LGFTNVDELPVTLATIMDKIVKGIPLKEKEGILRNSEGMDLVPSNIDLESMEVGLVNVMSREYTLKRYINSIKEGYDYILIDCRPSLGMLTINALATSDSVIIPVQAHYLPLKGMTGLIQTINKVKEQINPNLKIDGVLLTLADMKTRIGRTVAETLEKSYGSRMKIYSTVIPMGVKAVEASSGGKSLSIYAENSKPALAYKEFAKEVLKSDEKQRNKLKSTQCR